MLAEELTNGRLVEANSIFGWRLTPKRLNGELGGIPGEGLGARVVPQRNPTETLPWLRRGIPEAG
jgi:hypothetical protein